MATYPNHSLVASGSGTAGLGWQGNSRIHDHLAGYAPVSTVQSLVLAHRPLYPSSLRPPTAGNESLRKLRHAARVSHSAIWEYWRHAMHFIIPGRPGMTLPHSRE